MRRRLTIISVVLLLVVSMLAMTACSSNGADDITSTDNAVLSGKGEAIFARLDEISTNYPDRTYGTEAEALFAQYVVDKLTSMGYADESSSFTYDNILNDKKEELTSTNVIFKKDNPASDKTVIITAQLDNMKKCQGYGDEGVYAGATGVAIMLELAESLRDIALPYDVYFVGFGANSMNLKGVNEFYERFYIKHAKKDTLLMVDLSRPIGGDHMYMYTDEVDTIHSDYLYNVAKEGKLDFRSVPRDKQVMNTAIIENQPMLYSHVGVMSSALYFVSARIPTVNFVSVNWETPSAGATLERKGKENIASTEKDNYGYFLEAVGKDRIVKESDMVYTLLMDALTRDTFVETMESSIDKMPDYSIWSSVTLVMGLRLGIAILLIVLAVVISSKMRRDLPALSVEQFMHDMGMPSAPPKSDPFDSNSESNDPFSDVEKEFRRRDGKDDGANDSGKNDAGDDIFGI